MKFIIICRCTLCSGPGVAQRLRHCATSRAVSGSNPGGVGRRATDRTMCPGVDSAFKNEYLGFLVG
jgi:hypothetical protein